MPVAKLPVDLGTFSKGPGQEEEFYVRQYVGHKGRYGHEFLEFEVRPDGRLRYANQSNYKTRDDGVMIRKEVQLSSVTMAVLQKIIKDSEITSEDDAKWPAPDRLLEIIAGDVHVSFSLSKLGSLADVQASRDPEGLRTLYFLMQDQKCFVFSVVGLHFR